MPAASTELDPSQFDATIRSPTHTHVAIVLFHHGKDASIWDLFDTMALSLLDAAVQCYTVDCARAPSFCKRLNARSPSVFIYPPRGVGPTKVIHAVGQREEFRQEAIMHGIVKVLLEADEHTMLDAEKVDPFFASALKPVRVVLWMESSSPPPSFQAISAHPQLGLYVDFGVIAGNAAGTSIATELGLQGPPPSLVWMHGEDYATHDHFAGDVTDTQQVLEWALQALETSAAGSGCDPGFPEFDTGDPAVASIELTAVSATSDVEVAVTVPRKATFRQAKRAIAERLGNADVLRSGKLAIFDGSKVLIARDQDRLGEVREVVLLGVEAASYEKLAYGTNGCPAGQEIISAEECEQAIMSMGLTASPKWVSNFDGLPRHCSVRERGDKGSKERMHFNSASAGRGRSDLAPVCKASKTRGGDEMAMATALFRSWAAAAKEREALSPSAGGEGGQEHRATGRPPPARADTAAPPAASTGAAPGGWQRVRQSAIIVTQPAPEAGHVRLKLQPPVTAAEVKQAVAERTGNRDILENGVLAVWRGEAVGYVALAEGELVQNHDAKQLVLLGAHLFLYSKGTKGFNGCKPGMEIMSVQECEKAIVSMGLRPLPKWVSAYDGLPRFCSLRETLGSTGTERMHFNSAQSGQGRADLTPICRREDGAPPDARAAIENAARQTEANDVHGSQETEARSLIPQLTLAAHEDMLGVPGFKVVYLCDGPIAGDEEQMLASLEALFAAASDADDPPLAWMWLNLKEARRLKPQFDPPTLPSAVVLRVTKGKYQYAVAEHEEVDDEPLPLDQEALQHFISTVLGGEATFFPISAAKLSSGWSGTPMGI